MKVEMVKIHGGNFLMGSPDEEYGHKDNETLHLVTVSSFYMGRYQVTQEQYEAVMGDNPDKYKGTKFPEGYVSWYDAVEFCNKLSEKEGLEQVYSITDIKRVEGYIKKATVTADWSKNGCRLPTEAEWEYACRADTYTLFNTGDNITTDQANYGYSDKSKYRDADTLADSVELAGIFHDVTTPVGSFAPNAWGLYDMHGNVWECCWDWYGKYITQEQTNPKGPETGIRRVFRGGSGADLSQGMRSAYRKHYYPHTQNRTLGFRVARSAEI